MKRLTLLILILASLTAQASVEVVTRVVARDQSFRAQIRQLPLRHLISDVAVDGEFFKVVKGKSDDAVRFDDADKDLVMRAATAYYHLNLARE